MVKIMAKSAFIILYLMLINAKTVGCPTCLGRVTKTSPAFFKNIIYKDPSAKANESSAKSIRKEENTLHALIHKNYDQKI